MQAYFTRRAQAAAIVAGALSLGALAALHGASPAVYPPPHRPRPATGHPRRRLRAGRPRSAHLAGTLGTRVIAALGVAAVVWGWGVAQYPVLLPRTSVTLSNAANSNTTMVPLVILFIVAVLLIGLSFILLFILQHRRLLEAAQVGHALGLHRGRASPASTAAHLPASRHPGRRAGPDHPERHHPPPPGAPSELSGRLRARGHAEAA